MFTGIIETQGTVISVEREQSNEHIWIRSNISHELKIDQSVSHNGVCLTVVAIDADIYQVTAIEETLKRTNIGLLEKGDIVNLERAMLVGSRLDGHFVQGHVDTQGTCKLIEDVGGSWNIGIEYNPEKPEYFTVPKGSVCMNGVSLTIVDSKPGYFSVSIIPYTYNNTNLNQIKVGTQVNIEFDILGKYLSNMISNSYLSGS